MEWPFTDLEKANEEITELRKQIVELTEKIEFSQKMAQELVNLVGLRTRMFDEMEEKHNKLISGIMELKEKYGGKQDED